MRRAPTWRVRHWLPCVLATAGLLTGCDSAKDLTSAKTSPGDATPTAASYGGPSLLKTPRSTAAPSAASSAAPGPAATGPRGVPSSAGPRPVLVPSPRPTGRVLIDSFQRLPQAQQTKPGCDRLHVVVHNRSTGKVARLTVGFTTYWYPHSASGADTKRGRDVSIARAVSLPAGAKHRYQYDVCLPEHDTDKVFAEPVSTSWTWAQA